MTDLSCAKSACEKVATYTCSHCGRMFCGDHVDDHSEIDGE